MPAVNGLVIDYLLKQLWSNMWSVLYLVQDVLLFLFSFFTYLYIFDVFIFQNNLPRTAHLYCQTSLFCALESFAAWCNQPPLTALGDVNRSSTSSAKGRFQCCFGKDLDWLLSQSPHKSDAALCSVCTRDLSLTISGNYITYPRKKGSWKDDTSSSFSVGYVIVPREGTYFQIRWFQPIKKYARQIGSIPQGSGWRCFKKNETTTRLWLLIFKLVSSVFMLNVCFSFGGKKSEKVFDIRVCQGLTRRFDFLHYVLCMVCF